VVIFAYSGRLTESAPTIGWRDLDIVGFALSAAGFFLIVRRDVAAQRSKRVGHRANPRRCGAPLARLLCAVAATPDASRASPAHRHLALQEEHVQRREYGEPHSATRPRGTLFILPVFLQAVAGLSAFMTGVAFVPLTVALLVVSLSSARLSARIAPRYLVLSDFSWPSQAQFCFEVCSALTPRSLTFSPDDIDRRRARAVTWPTQQPHPVIGL